MFPKALVLIFAFMLWLLIMSCDAKDQTSSPSSTVEPDIYSYLRKPGKVTHVRYTSYTPPWPTRTEAWIDWENSRTRSWNVQWTDSPTNPSVCTSIQEGDTWYPCLPSLEKLDAEDFPRAYTSWPPIPLRGSDSELSLLLPAGAALGDDADGSELTPLKIGTEATTKGESQGDTDVVVSSWKIESDFDFPCEEGQTGAASFDYTTTEKGEPISEFITVSCGEERYQYLGVLYHEVQFVERSELPPDFFDVDSARTSLIADELSSAAAQLGTVFWLGEQVGEWTLAEAEHDGGSARLLYSRDDGRDREVVELTTRIAIGTGYRCDNAEPIPNDAYGASLCRVDMRDDVYRIVWTHPGFDLWLEKQSYPPEIGRDDMLALARRLERWEQHASGPLLTGEDVRYLVADSLELVCPGKLSQIREARSQSSFSFDRVSGEWTGVFGSFGDYAVPDAKPVAIPVSQREEVESTLSHNAAQFAECVLDEQPPPEEGDDEFGVEFVGQDDSGFSFELTGVDSELEAALAERWWRLRIDRSRWDEHRRRAG